MKVAIIIERADITLGGAERSALELAAVLQESGLEADILAAKGQAANNIRILCGPKPGKRACHFTFAAALKKHLAENHYDIVHSFLPFDFVDIYQPRGGCIAEGILRNAASYQNRFLESYKKMTAFANFRRSLLLRAEKKVCRNSNGPVIAALSNYVARQFKQHYGLDDRRIVVVPNGIKQIERPDAEVVAKLRAQIENQLGIAHTGKAVLFLFVANNFRLKGLAALIEAMHLAVERDKNCLAHLIIAGSGRAHKYRRLTERLNMQGRLIFLGPVRQIQNLLSAADVAVLPTFYDPSSRFILEAIAVEKPVITTKFNGATDLFVDNRHGKVIDTPERVSKLADALTYYTNTDNIQKASQAIVADNLKEKTSITRVAKQLIALYETILERGR
ncbi:MAG: glycosyltransferase family 4 protein [Planctomycetota bacterium]|jgi:glycosyltransferase involved in cell wall biosynthesis